MNVLNLKYIFKTPNAPVAVTYKLPQQVYPEHTHDVDEIVIVIEGKGTHILNGVEFDAKRGDVFFVRAHDWHEFKNVENLHILNILCQCTNSSDKNILPKFKYIKDSTINWEIRYDILDNLEKRMIPKLDSECNIIDQASAYMIKNLFTQVLAHLWRGRLFYGSHNNKNISKQTILAMMAYLNDRHADDISLDHLAKRHGFSLRSLNREFKDYTGLSPMHYLIQLRLTKAIEKLRTTQNSITDIAFTCGFNDSNYFSHCFRKKFLIAPREFRMASKTQNITLSV